MPTHLDQIYDEHYHLEEIFTIGMLAFLDTLILLRADFSQARGLFFLNLVMMAACLVAPYIQNRMPGRVAVIVRDWYVLFFMLTVYFEHNSLVPLINPNDVDQQLISLDHRLFGGHPTVLLERFTHPALTEFLQGIYASYYFLPLILCVALYLRRRKTEFHVVAATIALGFYTTYVGYYLFPAIGPRFTLDHLQSIPLTGVWIYEPLRDLLAGLEGVTRDCFPSGHTLVSLLTALLARRYLRGFARIAAPWTLFLVLSTVYLRYHYVVDVIAGTILTFPIYLFVPDLITRYLHYLNRKEEHSGLKHSHT